VRSRSASPVRRSAVPIRLASIATSSTAPALTPQTASTSGRGPEIPGGATGSQPTSAAPSTTPCAKTARAAVASAPRRSKSSAP
jgi:hypothetical protein